MSTKARRVDDRGLGEAHLEVQQQGQNLGLLDLYLGRGMEDLGLLP